MVPKLTALPRLKNGRVNGKVVQYAAECLSVETEVDTVVHACSDISFVPASS
jgi:hypothetical protein